MFETLQQIVGGDTLPYNTPKTSSDPLTKAKVLETGVHHTVEERNCLAKDRQSKNLHKKEECRSREVQDLIKPS